MQLLDSTLILETASTVSFNQTLQYTKSLSVCMHLHTIARFKRIVIINIKLLYLATNLLYKFLNGF